MRRSGTSCLILAGGRLAGQQLIRMALQPLGVAGRAKLLVECARGEAPVTTGPYDPVPAADPGRLRASHADRERVIDTLKAAFVQGRLTKDEFDTRVSQTFG